MDHQPRKRVEHHQDDALEDLSVVNLAESAPEERQNRGEPGAFFGTENHPRTVDIGQPAAAMAAIAGGVEIGLATAWTEHDSRIPSPAANAAPHSTMRKVRRKVRCGVRDDDPTPRVSSTLVSLYPPGFVSKA